MEIEIEGPLLGKATVCEPILRSLPQWFGIEAANLQYLRDIDALPTFITFNDGEVIGFLTLKSHNEIAQEIHIMGLIPTMHRKGVGRVLLSRVEDYLREKSVEYLQIKTLSNKHPDLNYARTGAFYFAMGFRPLERFNHLWGEQSPALLMVKKL